MSNTLLFQLKAVTIKKWMQPTFVDLNWAFYNNQNWAIVGPNGAGKTVLAEAIAGKGWVSAGQIDYAWIEKSKNRTDAIRNSIAYVAFTEHSRQFSYANHYYQQRFQSTEADEAITVREYLFGEARTLPQTPLLEMLDIGPLLDLHFIKLSNGQTRRVRLAKGLLRKPKLLIADNFFTGLDRETRARMSELLNQLTANGLKLLLTTSSKEIPGCITHVLEVADFKTKGSYDRESFLAKATTKNGRRHHTLPTTFSKAGEDGRYNFELAVKMTDVHLSYGNKQILKGVNWTVKKGDKWALTGPNGSGKTSLLSLIYADNPQAYSQKIVLFDRPKGSGETIWQIKKKIGFISPELYTYFRSASPAMEVVATGYTDSLVLQRKVTHVQAEGIRQLFRYFGVEHLLHRSYRQLSTGEKRLVLIIRALVKNAPVLIMDEPFQGLDEGLQERCLELLESYCHADRTLIYVSHYKKEIPGFVDKRIGLKRGREVIELPDF